MEGVGVRGSDRKVSAGSSPIHSCVTLGHLLDKV